MEYDADLFSSICLGTHLYQYIDKWCSEASNKEAEMIVSAVAASVFLLLLSFSSAKKKLYYEEESHPHPFIRIIGILYVITDYIELLSIVKQERKLNRSKMIKQVFLVAEKISDKVLVDDVLTNFQDIFAENSEAIEKYNKKLHTLVKSYEDSAYNRRNKKAKK